MTEELAIYVVYCSPSDYPGKYVVRRWVGERADPRPLAVTDDLDAAREALPDGLICLPRRTDDDWTIVETWL